MEKHTLIALMENKPGVLNRVSSLFRRRNYNIEALSVGHSETTGISRMTIVLHGDERIVEQVVKQLEKLINVTGSYAFVNSLDWVLYPSFLTITLSFLFFSSFNVIGVTPTIAPSI